MFIYQAVIMLAVVLIFCLLAFVFKIKNRTILALSILVLVVGGGLSLSLIQAYFGNQYYDQKINTELYKNLIMTEEQKSSLPRIFSDFKDIDTVQDQYSAALEKTYDIQDGAVNSSVKVDLYLFSDKAGADEYFKLRQTFYEYKYYMQIDGKLSKKSPGDDTFRYLTSYIGSYYKDYKELLYVPSKIYYLSESVIQSGNLIVSINEKSNKPVTEKGKILEKIGQMLTTTK